MIRLGRAGPGRLALADRVPLLGAGHEVAVSQLGPARSPSGSGTKVPGSGSDQAPGSAADHRRQRRIAGQRRRPMTIVVDHHLHGLLMLQRPERPLEVLRVVLRPDPDVAPLDAQDLVGHPHQPLDVADFGLLRQLEDRHVPPLAAGPGPPRARKGSDTPSFMT